mmetsp:Transcript_46213/g.122045  ORF Transcript_46213/g.122045 Transcript_46213/m.122045 type:complete len:92 (-) Transcript_46213:345-620(-)
MISATRRKWCGGLQLCTVAAVRPVPIAGPERQPSSQLARVSSGPGRAGCSAKAHSTECGRTSHMFRVAGAQSHPFVAVGSDLCFSCLLQRL